jgi:hypothetical protein
MAPYPLPETEAARTDENVPKGVDLFHYVLDCMDKGDDIIVICERLVAIGYAENDAYKIVGDVAERRRHHLRAQLTAESPRATESPGRTNMIVGACVCIAGLAITGLGAAMAGPGGAYVFTVGMIVFGAVQFVRGMIQADVHADSESDSQ